MQQRVERAPTGMDRLENLQELKLAWCDSLAALPEGLWGGMSTLEKLDLTNCSSLQVIVDTPKPQLLVATGFSVFSAVTQSAVR